MFGLAAKWSKARPDRLTRLANAIESLGEQDRRQIDESGRVERLRAEGAQGLYALCRNFIDALNEKLSEPALTLDPQEYPAEACSYGAPGLFQINLGGRILQLEFFAPGKLVVTDEFRQPYVLYGTRRCFNQDYLDRHMVYEMAIFFCPEAEHGQWHYFDSRTHGSGKLTQDFLVSAMTRLL